MPLESAVLADGGQILASKDVIKELQGLLGTFDESSAAATGDGEQHLEKTEEELDEDAFRLLNPTSAVTWCCCAGWDSVSRSWANAD